MGINVDTNKKENLENMLNTARKGYRKWCLK
jgi:hypothetical protein